MHRSSVELVADGRKWPAGTLLLLRDQPYGQYLKDLFEVQRYPEGEPPYDVAGWTLPLLMGVHRVAVMERLEGPFDKLSTVNEALESFTGDPRIGPAQGGWRSTHSSAVWPAWCAIYREAREPARERRSAS